MSVQASRVKASSNAKLRNVMKNVYAILLSLLGLVGIIFNRFAVEETFRIMPISAWGRPSVWLARIIVILSGTFFVLFGLLTMMGYLK